MLLTTPKILFEHNRRAFDSSERNLRPQEPDYDDNCDWLMSLANQNSTKSASLSTVRLVELDRVRNDIRVPIPKEWSPKGELVAALEEAQITVGLFLGSNQVLNWDQAHV